MLSTDFAGGDRRNAAKTWGWQAVSDGLCGEVVQTARNLRKFGIILPADHFAQPVSAKIMMSPSVSGLRLGCGSGAQALDEVKSERLAETLRETDPNNKRGAHDIDEYAGIEVPHSGKHSCRLRPDSLLRRTVRFVRRVGHLRTFLTQQTVRLPGVEWQRVEPPHQRMDNCGYYVPDYVQDQENGRNDKSAVEFRI